MNSFYPVPGSGKSRRNHCSLAPVLSGEISATALALKLDHTSKSPGGVAHPQMQAPPPELLIQQVWSEAQEFPFLAAL